MTEKPDITIETDRSVAVITYRREAALNALTRSMRVQMHSAYPRFARDPLIYAVVQRSASLRAFSAGSDVRELLTLAHSDLAEARRAFQEEYALDWQIECFSKPTVSLIDGMVMGGGVGVSQYGTHRVAGESYRWAMPETRIGFFPDVGMAHVLARMPNSIGMYLGLTGRAVGPADAFALGLVTHCISASEFDAIIEGLADVWPVDPLLDERHGDPGPGALAPLTEVIAHCFAAPTVEEIVGRLAAVSGMHGDWAKEVAGELRQRSAIALKVTHRHIRQSADRDIRETLMADYRLACRFLEAGEFREGVRAALIDKDNAPRWRPARLEDVTEAMVADYFAPLQEDWALPTRGEMQEARA